MLKRVESAITVADSCQSISPGPTPKKRPYTQVFSTPVTCRLLQKPRHEVTPESPLPFISTKRASRTLFKEREKSSKVEAQTQTEASRDVPWATLQQTLTSTAWLANATGMTLEVVAEVLNAALYTELLSLAQRHFGILRQMGDFDHEDTATLAQQYIFDHHIIRVERYFGAANGGSGHYETRTGTYLPPSTVADCVPPTPPGSDTPEEKQDEGVRCVIDRVSQPSSLVREKTEQDDSLLESHGVRMGHVESETLLPWPASGLLEGKGSCRNATVKDQDSADVGTDMGNDECGASDLRRSKRLLRGRRNS